MRIRLAFLVVLPFLAVSMIASAFDKKNLTSEWKWVREDPQDWSLRDDGALRLRTQPGQVWGGKDDAENVLVRKTPAGGGPASIEATVTLENPVRKYEQVGVLVYVDDRQFVKLIVEFIDGEYYVVMAREYEKKGQVVAKIATGAKTARLRYEVEGDQVKGLYKTDLETAEWQEAAVTELPAKLDRHFALFTQSGPAEETRWATVREVRVEE